MIPVNVTIQYERGGRSASAPLRLSMDMTVQAAIGACIETLGLPASGRYHLSFRRAALAPEAKLFTLGIIEGTILQLTAEDASATRASASESGALVAGLLQRLGAIGDAAGPLPVITTLASPGGGPVFTLSRTRALIGRADERVGYPAHVFDVELSALDPNRSVSRPHALIVYAVGDRGASAFTIRDLYSRRGVLVNQTRIGPSQAYPVTPGDQLIFGDVQLEFHLL